MQTTIHSLDYEARGVARVGGKTVFVQGALPLETVRIRITQEKASFALADTEAVIEASPFRVQAACAHYGECGGCALQHADFAAQVAYKQRVFEEQLQRIGKVQPAVYLPPIYGNAWGYRSRTRLSVHITREGEVRLGYQAKHSHRIVPVSQCPVLPPFWRAASFRGSFCSVALTEEAGAATRPAPRSGAHPARRLGHCAA